MKRIISMFLCVALLMCVIPVYANAETTNDDESVFETYGDFVLEIYYRDQDKSIAGIVGYNGNATELEIPSVIGGNQIDCIDEYAFENCLSLESVTIGGEIETLYVYAFSGCANLNTVTFLGADTSLWDNVFDGCSADLTINAYYASLALRYAISHGINCNILDNYSDFYNYEILPDGTAIITEMKADGPSNRIIPCSIDGYAVTQVASGACSGNKYIKTIVVQEGVVSIGANAFSNNANLTSVWLPSSIASISGSAFLNCPNLSDISVAADNPVYSSLNGNLLSADGKTLICIPAGNAGYTIDIPSSITAIDEYALLTSKTVTVVIPSTVQLISQDAFACCKDLTIYCEMNSEAYMFAITFGIKYVTFEGDFIYDIKDDNTVEIIKITCTQPKDVVIPSEIQGYPVTSIGSYIAPNNKNVLSITVPDSVTQLADYCFANGVCKHIYLPSTVKVIPQYVISGSICEEFIVPEGVEEISSNAFKNNNYVKSVVLPSTLKTIGDYAFYRCEELESINIPEGVTSIGLMAFYNCCSLAEITLPESITNFGDYVFDSCWDLERIIIKSKVKELSKCFCEDCKSLKYVELPDTLETISYASFAYCTSLRNITIPNSVTVIGAKAFARCPFENVVLPNSIVEIGKNAYKDCKKLKSIELQEGLLRIGESAFIGCTLLESITIPDSVNRISYALTGQDSRTLIIYGHINTYAETYANTLHYRFRPLDAGDADGDGIIGMSDYSMLLNYIYGEPLSDDAIKLLDVNYDGAVDAFDLFEIDKAINA